MFETFLQFLPAILSAVASFVGILTANKLSNYRIQQLEKEVSKMNQLVGEVPVIKKEIELLKDRVDKLERHFE